MHTPGPWHVGDDVFPNEDNIYGPDRIIVGSAAQHREEVKANARLIAAAPDLLEALEASIEDMAYAEIELRSLSFLFANVLKERIKLCKQVIVKAR